VARVVIADAEGPGDRTAYAREFFENSLFTHQAMVTQLSSGDSECTEEGELHPASVTRLSVGIGSLKATSPARPLAKGTPLPVSNTFSNTSTL